MRPIPEGYAAVMDNNHVIQDGDMYGFRHWGKNDAWSKMSMDAFIGKTLGAAEEIYKGSYDILFISGKIAPRFKTDKPYPYGY